MKISEIDWGKDGPPVPGERMTDSQFVIWKKHNDLFWEREYILIKMWDYIIAGIVLLTVFALGYFIGLNFN